MERLVVAGAIAFAGLVALSAMIGPDHGWRMIKFESDDELRVEVPSGSPLTSSESAFAATEVRIENARAVVEIIPEERADISVTLQAPGTAKPMGARVDAGALILDGGLRGGLRRCSTEEADSFARVLIRMPENVELTVSDAVVAKIGDAQSLQLSASGCGPITFADVKGNVEISSAGSGDISGGDVQSATVRLAGASDLKLGEVRQDLSVSVAGSGEVVVGRVAGALNAEIAGSGDVEVAGGGMRALDASIAGSGAVTVRGPVERVNARLMGSGGVVVEGAVVDLDVRMMGAGDVEVASATRVRQSVMGSGKVRIGDTVGAPPPPAPPQPPEPPKAP
jgi:hypothetical protein